MRTYDPTKPLIYLQIPQCAGSSLVFLLARWFQPGYQRLSQDESREIEKPKIAFQDSEGNWKTSNGCIQGHFDHRLGRGLPYYLPEVKQYVSILRDPFDIAVSLYFSAKQKSRTGDYRSRGKPVDIRKQFPNVVNYVNHYPFSIFEHFPIDIDLSNYWQKLSEQFVYLGIFEDLKESINQMARVLGKKPFEIPHLNVSEYDEPIPESLREAFYSDYPLLKRIYDFAVAHYRST